MTQAARIPAAAMQTYWVMRVTFTLLPIIAGLDKFANYLVDWKQYLAPVLPQTLNVSADVFMRGVGVIEIVAGILVAIVPRWFSYVVCVWLLAIVANLLLRGGYYDVGLRDLALAAGAFGLGRLAQAVWEERRT